MTVISVTRLRLRSPRYLPQFFWYAILSTIQARRTPGCLAARAIRDVGNAFWTATAWQDEAAMRAYVASGAHGRAMPKLKEWCDEASVAHWRQDDPALPSWDEAHRRMLEVGRRSKVRHPTAAHLAFDIPKPRA